jgi:hypothetical protein
MAQKGPLNGADAALQRQLEARENDLVQAKLSQSFAAPAISRGPRQYWRLEKGV